MFVCYSRFGTAQSRRRTGPRKYIRGTTQILRAFHVQSFYGHAGAARSIPYRFASQSGCAHGLHGRRNGLQDAPDFRCIPPTNIVRTCMHIRIKSIQIAERRIGRVSKTNACISAIQNGSRARGAVSGLKFQRSHVAPVVRFGEQRSATASTLSMCIRLWWALSAEAGPT